MPGPRSGGDDHRVGNAAPARAPGGHAWASALRRPGTGARGLLLALLLAAAVHPQDRLGAQAAPPKKLRAALERVYGTDARTDTLVIDGAPVYRVARGDAVLGFAQVRNVKGKDQPITFLVATDSTLVLKDVDILVYREAYGGEVAYEPWRRQFRGKGPADPLRPDADIRGISGATISVHAVTAGVRRTLQDFLRWRTEGRL